MRVWPWFIFVGLVANVVDVALYAGKPLQPVFIVCAVVCGLTLLFDRGVNV